MRGAGWTGASRHARPISGEDDDLVRRRLGRRKGEQLRAGPDVAKDAARDEGIGDCRDAMTTAAAARAAENIHDEGPLNELGPGAALGEVARGVSATRRAGGRELWRRSSQHDPIPGVTRRAPETRSPRRERPDCTRRRSPRGIRLEPPPRTRPPREPAGTPVQGALRRKRTAPRRDRRLSSNASSAASTPASRRSSSARATTPSSFGVETESSPSAPLPLRALSPSAGEAVRGRRGADTDSRPKCPSTKEAPRVDDTRGLLRIQLA